MLAISCSPPQFRVLGSVCAYLTLDVTAVTGQDVATVRAAYAAMDVTIRHAIRPVPAK
ncbi:MULTISPECIES: hypothetical protein [Streptomyces]|uniref:Uncharacterized protein n=1 Tax=Streptomyces fimbriatus TaxID=68197 RepID=A0ABW0DF97_STRFI